MKPSPVLATALAVIALSLLAACGGTGVATPTTKAQAAITTPAPSSSTTAPASSQAFPTTNAPGSTISATTPPQTPLPPASTVPPITTLITITTSQAPVVTTSVPPVTTTTPPPPPTTATAPASQPPATEVTVTVSLAGFSPSAVTIVKGGVVNMRVSGHDEWKIASDDGQPDLTIGSGITMPFMFFDKGKTTYHLVLKPECTLVVTVV